jgi:hypothetical protein
MERTPPDRIFFFWSVNACFAVPLRKPSRNEPSEIHDCGRQTPGKRTGTPQDAADLMRLKECFFFFEKLLPQLVRLFGRPEVRGGRTYEDRLLPQHSLCWDFLPPFQCCAEQTFFELFPGYGYEVYHMFWGHSRTLHVGGVMFRVEISKRLACWLANHFVYLRAMRDSLRVFLPSVSKLLFMVGHEVELRHRGTQHCSIVINFFLYD